MRGFGSTWPRRTIFAAFHDGAKRKRGGGIDGTTSAAARNVVVSVMVRFPSNSIVAKINVQLYQWLAGGKQLVGDGGEMSTNTLPSAMRRHIRNR